MASISIPGELEFHSPIDLAVLLGAGTFFLNGKHESKNQYLLVLQHIG